MKSQIPLEPSPADATSDTAMDGSYFGAIPGDDAWLESLLLQDAVLQPHIADGGFSARVMGSLPAPRKAISRWLVPSMGAIGGAFAFGVTPAGSYVASNLSGLMNLSHLSLAQVWLLVPIALIYAYSFGTIRQP